MANTVPLMRVARWILLRSQMDRRRAGASCRTALFDRDQLPLLGDVPRWARLSFRNERDQTELIIFLRPTVIENAT